MKAVPPLALTLAAMFQATGNLGETKPPKHGRESIARAVCSIREHPMLVTSAASQSNV